MTKINLIKKPIIQNKLNITFNNPSGNIIEEIQEQDLTGTSGGASPAISAIISWALTVLSTLSATSVAVVSVSATDPGRVCTVSAECSADYKPCG